jgi:spore coat polysaccharide biosynthesis protein SpsF (cytidylyltransferase family)
LSRRLKIIAIIQARMQSTRLPNKALRPMAGRCSIEWIADRLRTCKELDGMVLCTSIRPENDRLARFGQKIGLPVFRGSETDLVSRLLGTAKQFKANAVVRVTGDCPLVDPKLVDQICALYRKNERRADFVTNVYPPTYPDGLDLDILPTKTLERMDREIKTPLHREWLTTYILERPKRFRILNMRAAQDFSPYRWTLDYPKDMVFLRKVFTAMRRRPVGFSMEDVMTLLQKHPAWIRINQTHVDKTILKGFRSHAYHTLAQASRGGQR